MPRPTPDPCSRLEDRARLGVVGKRKSLDGSGVLEGDAQVGGHRSPPGGLDRELERLRGRVDEAVKRIGLACCCRFALLGPAGGPRDGTLTRFYDDTLCQSHLRFLWRGARTTGRLTR